MVLRDTTELEVEREQGVRLSARARERAYAIPAHPAHIDLRLDANEGPAPDLAGGAPTIALEPDALRRYPGAAALEGALARRLGIDAERVLVTAGGDDAIDRACRACLEAGREAIVPVPTFEMIPKFARLAGARVLEVAWSGGRFPCEDIARAVGPQTSMIAVVSPNNPTGAVATGENLRALSEAAPAALLLVDLAYTEFTDEDLTAIALGLANAVIVRTFSKAYGLAGLRVGYAAGPARVIAAMRAMGSPFPVSSVSAAAAMRALESPPQRAVERVRIERVELERVLGGVGARPIPSQANFVLAEFDDAEWTAAALAGLGIAVRSFTPSGPLAGCLRITCPGESAGFERLCQGLRAALRPEALLFDMDGVLADVSGSYRMAIVKTAELFGVRLSVAEVANAKQEPEANNDWVVTRRLLARHGVDAPLEEVTSRFEGLYQGCDGAEGLCVAERLIPERALLVRLAERLTIGIVTGRPRRDCERFLARTGIRELFRAVVCMEDAPLKPDPAPVRLALERLDVGAAWLVGDTADDIAAARRAGVVPIGVPAPGTEVDIAHTAREFWGAGAAAVVSSLAELEDMLP